MCGFLSWGEVKKTKQIIWLNDDRLNDRRGKELQAYETDPAEWRGHGSLAWYYGLKSSDIIHHECEDFSDPSNFPLEIVEDIKSGKFRSFGIAVGILTPSAEEEYDRIVDTAWEEYNRIVKPAREEYNRIVDTAWEESDRIVDPAWEEYNRIAKPAREEFGRITRKTFWNLAIDPDNRVNEWK